MSLDMKNASVMVLDSGFQYSSQDISKSLYRAFERICGSENVYNFTTGSACEFSEKALTVHSLFQDRPGPDHNDIIALACDPILRYAALTQIDLIIAIHGYHINPVVIECLRSSCPNTKTAVWLVDEPQQVDISKTWAERYDYVFTNDKNTISVHGIERSFHLPTAFDDEIFNIDKEKLDDKYKSEILICGSIYPERFEFIEKIYDYIKKRNIKIIGKIVRRDQYFSKPKLNQIYNDSIVPISEMAKYMAGADIVLDIPRRSDLSEFGRTNKQGITASSISPRIYETAASESLILTTNSRDEIKQLFDEDEHVTYDDIEDCVNKIIYYLENEDERKQITEKAKKKVFDKHKFVDRVNQIADYLPEKPLNTRVVGLNLDQPIQNSVAKNLFFDIWQKNIKDNTEFVNIGSLNDFLNTGKDKFALVISNGPSLEKNIDKLKELFDDESLKNKFDIFSMNSSYKELRKKGIVPKFHNQIHPTEDQMKHFENVPHDKTVFLCASIISNKVISSWTGDKRLYIPMGIIKAGIEIPKEYENKFSLVESALVVAFSTTCIAIHFGYEKIIWLGLDFSYVNNKKYAFQKPNYKDMFRNGFIVKEDVHGGPVITNNVMLDACKFMIALSNGQRDAEFYNLTEDGILYDDNVNRMNIDNFIEKIKNGDQ